MICSKISLLLVEHDSVVAVVVTIHGCICNIGRAVLLVFTQALTLPTLEEKQILDLTSNLVQLTVPMSKPHWHWTFANHFIVTHLGLQALGKGQCALTGQIQRDEIIQSQFHILNLRNKSCRRTETWVYYLSEICQNSIRAIYDSPGVWRSQTWTSSAVFQLFFSGAVACVQSTTYYW